MSQSHYVIQSKIKNNEEKEVNLEIKLKTTTFSGRLVYQVVCINTNERIEINKLKKKNKMRSLMVGSISHDLRTPLNGISILLNLMLKLKTVFKLPDKLVEDYLKPSLYNCKHLMCLINNILDYTQEEFDEEPRMDYEPVDLKKEIMGIG